MDADEAYERRKAAWFSEQPRVADERPTPSGPTEALAEQQPDDDTKSLKAAWRDLVEAKKDLRKVARETAALTEQFRKLDATAAGAAQEAIDARVELGDQLRGIATTVAALEAVINEVRSAADGLRVRLDVADLLHDASPGRRAMVSKLAAAERPSDPRAWLEALNLPPEEQPVVETGSETREQRRLREAREFAAHQRNRRY